jgi:peptidyl-prolyl cis-trans isomerase C
MSVRTPIHAAAIFALAAGLLQGCDRPSPIAEAAAVVDSSTVAAMVNGEPIYVSDVLLEAEARGVKDPGAELEVDSGDFHKVLDQLIDTKLMAMEARSRGLDEEPQARHRLETARDSILGNILVEAIVADRIDEASIRKMYDEQIKIWELGEEARVRQIVTATKAEIDDIVTQLQRGADFSVLASQKSIDEETRLEGGDIGFVSDDDVTPEFARAIKSTPTGGVSKPFETSTGWRLLKVEERRQERPPAIEELRPKILSYLTMLQIDETLKQLRSEANVERSTKPKNAPLDGDTFDTDAAPRRKAVVKFDAAAPKAPAAAPNAATPAPAPVDRPAEAGPGDTVIAPKGASKPAGSNSQAARPAPLGASDPAPASKP